MFNANEDTAQIIILDILRYSGTKNQYHVFYAHQKTDKKKILAVHFIVFFSIVLLMVIILYRRLIFWPNFN